jgi:hypothetical protein
LAFITSGTYVFFLTYFQLVGLELGGSLTRFLERKESKKEFKRKYQRLPTTKVRRSKEQQKNREDIYKERIDTSYGAGVGLTAGITKRRKIEKNETTAVAEVKCKCGRVHHKRTTH